tara:strand:- start:101 stop:490 length:390 start_codon:yes stop_codon:yes gene_type:complete
MYKSSVKSVISVVTDNLVSPKKIFLALDEGGVRGVVLRGVVMRGVVMRGVELPNRITGLGSDTLGTLPPHSAHTYHSLLEVSHRSDLSFSSSLLQQYARNSFSAAKRPHSHSMFHIGFSAQCRVNERSD